MKPIDKSKFDSIKKLLVEEESFPLRYTFKFIVPKDKLYELMSLFPNEKELSVKESKKGRFISVTIKRLVYVVDEVLKVYESASVIEGILSL